MENKHAIWMQDLLGEVKRNPSEESIKLMEHGGVCCAVHNSHVEGITQLKEAANDCKTKEDYVKFLNESFPLEIEEDDGE